MNKAEELRKLQEKLKREKSRAMEIIETIRNEIDEDMNKWCHVAYDLEQYDIDILKEEGFTVTKDTDTFTEEPCHRITWD